VSGDRVGVLGPATIDEISLDGGPVQIRPGGTPRYAERALRLAGAEPVVFETGMLRSHLQHDGSGTRQQLSSLPEPLTPRAAAELLPALEGCRWLLLGGQTGADFPAETLGVLAGAGHLLCLDGQGLVRGSEAGPVRLRPVEAAAMAGVTALKLNASEAEAAGPLTVAEQLVTMAAAGCRVTAAGETTLIEGSGRPFPDPTGAGDSFGALYCLARTRGLAPAAAAAWSQHQVEQIYQRR
jgi:sugar/nucleoside kinase (ribokinase family)